MKLIIAVIHKDDSHNVIHALTKAGHYVTKLASSGGFLSQGNTTLLIGTDEEKVPAIIDLIKSEAKQRTEKIPTMTSYETPDSAVPTLVDVVVGGATIFVVDVDQFEKF